MSNDRYLQCASSEGSETRDCGSLGKGSTVDGLALPWIDDVRTRWMLQIPEYKVLDIQERIRRSTNPRISYRKWLMKNAETQTQLSIRLAWYRRLLRKARICLIERWTAVSIVCVLWVHELGHAKAVNSHVDLACQTTIATL